jgi:hypothetical protein
MRSMSLKACITATAATIKRLERLEATRAFDRKLISEEDDKAIIERVVTGAKLGEAEPLRVYFRHLRHGRMPLSLLAPLSPSSSTPKKRARAKAKPATKLPGKAP